jgi:hypothetical protein
MLALPFDRPREEDVVFPMDVLLQIGFNSRDAESPSLPVSAP